MIDKFSEKKTFQDCLGWSFLRSILYVKYYSLPTIQTQSYLTDPGSISIDSMRLA